MKQGLSRPRQNIHNIIINSIPFSSTGQESSHSFCSRSEESLIPCATGWWTLAWALRSCVRGRREGARAPLGKKGPQNPNGGQYSRNLLTNHTNFKPRPTRPFSKTHAGQLVGDQAFPQVPWGPWCRTRKRLAGRQPLRCLLSRGLQS